MENVLPPVRPLPLHGVAGTRQIEQDAAARLPPHTLMRRAGTAVARLALAVAPHARRAWIAAGPGNNGGDGLEAAIALHGAGHRVDVTLLADAATLPADARDALSRAQAAGVVITDRIHDDTLDRQDLAIDALLGIGASRAPTGLLADAVRRLNALACPVLAIDVPSGLNADTGMPLGDACVRASHTLTLLTAKPGLFTGAGRDHAGSVWLDRLGIVDPSSRPDAWLAAPPAAETVRRHAQHKGTFGDLAVVGGAAGMTGAALLAARAASAAGAGRVFVNLLDGGSVRLDPLRPELMFRQHWIDGDAAALARSTVVCGCGGGDAVRAVLHRLLDHVPRLVLDADALNAVAADAALQDALEARADRGQATVLTPHPLEAARLLSVTTTEVQRDRVNAAMRLASQWRCIAVLKGSGTVVAAPARPPSINPSGNASLASAGTGDVLAGWLAGSWAASAGEAADAFNVAVAAVYRHGRAAEPAPAGPMRASALIERLAGATGGAL